MTPAGSIVRLRFACREVALCSNPAAGASTIGWCPRQSSAEFGLGHLPSFRSRLDEVDANRLATGNFRLRLASARSHVGSRSNPLASTGAIESVSVPVIVVAGWHQSVTSGLARARGWRGAGAHRPRSARTGGSSSARAPVGCHATGPAWAPAGPDVPRRIGARRPWSLRTLLEP